MLSPNNVVRNERIKAAVASKMKSQKMKIIKNGFRKHFFEEIYINSFLSVRYR